MRMQVNQQASNFPLILKRYKKNHILMGLWKDSQDNQSLIEVENNIANILKEDL
jgi:hypothetical protein